MTYRRLKDMLHREHTRSCWGCLLVYREDFLKFYNGELCLDIGCNVGFLAGMVGKERYIGLDVVYYGKKPKYFVLGDAHHLPFKDEAFGFVSMIETIEHLSDPHCALQEVKRVLKPDGRLFMQCPIADSPHADHDPTHCYGFHVWSLSRLLHQVFSHSNCVSVERKGGSLITKVVK